MKPQLSLKFFFLLVAVVALAAWFWQFKIVAEREREMAVQLLFESPDEWWDGPNDRIGDPVSVLRAVNHLREMGKQRAVEAMRLFTAKHPNRSGALRNVLPLLFETPPVSCEFHGHWNEHDVFYVDDLVFHGNFYRSGSAAGLDPKLLNWLEAHGKIRKHAMSPPNNPFASVDRALQKLKTSDWGSAWLRDDELAANGTIDCYFYSQIINSTHHLSDTGKPFEFHWGFDGDPANRGLWERYKSQLVNAGIYWDDDKMQYSIQEPATIK